MREKKANRKQNIFRAIKLAACILITALGIYVFVGEGFSDYYSSKSYDVQVEVLSGEVVFVSKGNLLSYVRVLDGDVINLDRKMTRGQEYKYTLPELNLPEKYIDAIVEARGTGPQLSLHFVYRWITPTAVILIVFKGLFMLVSAFILCYSVWHIERGIGLLKQGGAVRWPAAITMSGAMLLTFNPFSSKRTSISKFARYVGIGVASDYDVSKVINNFTKWTAAFVALAFLFLLFFRIIGEKDKDENQRNCWEFSHRFFILAMILMILRCVSFFHVAESPAGRFSYTAFLVQLILISFFLYFVLCLNKKISFERYIWILMGVGTAAFPVAIAISDTWAEGGTLFAVQFIAVVIAVAAIRFIPMPESCREAGSTVLFWPAIFISVIPFITSLYIELIAILNQREVFIAGVKKYYVLGMALLLIAGIALPVFVKQLRFRLAGIKSICYPILVAGIAALSVQPAAIGIYEADLYETANYSVLISDFLNHGIVPIVGHYGGHMMSGVWEGILYGLLNSDNYSGALSPYAGCATIITTLCFFYLLKYVWDEDMALFGALLFPFAGYWDYYGQGMLIAIAVLAFAAKNTLLRAVWIWIAFAWVVLQRLDMGSAFGVAAVVALAAYCVIHKSKDAAKKIGISFLIVAGAAGIIWCVICLFGGVNPILRFFEFVKASASNGTWARETLGDTGKADFSWGYIFVPMGVSLGLGYTLISRRFREDAGEERYLLLLIFGAAYVANIQRSLVRHTLAAGNYSVVLWSSLVFIALFISVKKNRAAFLPTFGAMIVFASLLGSQDAYAEKSVLETASTGLTSHIDSWTVDKMRFEDAQDETDRLSFWEFNAVQGNKLSRVALDEKSQNQIELFGEAIDLLLDENETYLDFENHTFLYSATGRRNPVYVSQSPMQLSGEFMQRQFIDEVERDDVPIAILPATGESNFASVRLDALENAYRYYLVSEYIYENFKPLCSVGEYAIWVRPEKYDEKLARIRGMEEVEQLNNFVAGFSFSHLDMEMMANGMKLTALKSDPFIAGLENGIDLTGYIGGTMKMILDCTTSVEGELKLYYTTEADESFSEAKTSCANIKGRGTAELFVPVTEYTKLRLDIPDGSVVNITSLRTTSSLALIDYGYDIFRKTVENDKLLTDDSAHNYRLRLLPLLWGENDVKDAASGEELCTLMPDETGRIFGSSDTESLDRTGSCYLLMDITYSGTDNDLAGTDDEKAEAVLRAGEAGSDGFTEQARYVFTLEEGNHTYLIRLSSDYCWKTGDMKDFRIDSPETVEVTSMRIIDGD